MSDFNALILRGGAIGDFILTLPVMQCLRRHRPQARIEIVGYPRAADLAVAGGLAGRIHSLDDAAMATLFSREFNPAAIALDWRGMDVILSYLHDPGGMVRANLEQAAGRAVLTCSPLVHAGHAIDHLLQPLRALGISPCGREYAQLTLPADATERARKRMDELGGNVVILHPGSGGLQKNWPLVKYLELAERMRRELAVVPVLALGEADDAIVGQLGRLKTTIPILAGLPLVQLAAVLAVCRGYVGNDSGITHLAAATGIPVVAVFGPTDPRVWAPRSPNVCVVSSTPATADGLQALPVAEVWRAFVQSQVQQGKGGDS